MICPPFRYVRAPLATLLLAVALPATVSGQEDSQAPPALFEAVTGKPTREKTHSVKPRRARAVRARLDALSRQTQRDILLNLFDDAHLVAKRTSFERHAPGGFIWRGRLDRAHEGVTLVVRDGVMVGTVFADGRTFEIQYAGDGTHEVLELDPAAFPSDDAPLEADANTASDAVSDAVIVSDAATEIDVMVVWTPAARTSAGGTTAMQNLVTLSVANANAAYANSQVNTRLRLVFSGEVQYAEQTSNISNDLSRLASPSDGYLDTVHSLRDQHRADVVTLIGNYVGYCGIGYLMGSASTTFASSAFNVVERSCAAGNLSYAHEVGHNQGLHHDPPNAGGMGGAYSYAFGFQDPAGTFRTVMSYGTARRVMHLSNPNVSYGDRPTGVVNAQDNARALNNTAPYVANFRQAVTSSCSYTVSPSSLSFASAGGSTTVSITTSTGCTWSASTGATWLSVGAASGTGSATVTVTAAANTAAARSAGLTIAGKVVTVSQAAGACTYTVSPAALSFANGGGNANISVVTTSGCAWTLNNSHAWLTASATSGSGPATVMVTAAANGATARSGSFMVAGKTVAVSQAGATCSFTLSQQSLSFSKNGGSASISVTASPGCSWTTSVSAAWLSRTPASASGSGTVTVTAARNSSAARTGVVTIAGRNVTVSQASAVSTRKGRDTK